jgi:hypothetical protein
MKSFLIKYHFETGSKEDWHESIRQFIAAIENDPELSGKISYRAMKTPSDDYYHLATALDQSTVEALGRADFFDRYTQTTDRVSGGGVEVIPIEVIAETAYRP